MSIEFESPANRIIQQFQPKNQFILNTSLPDITFLRQLSVQGRLRYFQGISIGAGTPITITPSIGETLFIYKVLLSANLVQEVRVLNDSNLRVRINVLNAVEIDFLDSLVGDGIKTITVTNSANNVQASIFGWVENTSRIRDVTT